MIIKVIDENKPSQPRGKQSANYENWACWYTRITGIWQSVWLEPTTEAYVKGIRLQPNIDENYLKIDIEVSQIPKNSVLRLTSYFQGENKTLLKRR